MLDAGKFKTLRIDEDHQIVVTMSPEGFLEAHVFYDPESTTSLTNDNILEHYRMNRGVWTNINETYHRIGDQK
jgi:hypothetical protein